jgi:hypothetical protein
VCSAATAGLSVVLGGLGPLACTTATGGVVGGDPIAAGPAAEGPCSGSSHTWTDLYECYFGPTGKGSCVGQSFCHGAPTQLGAQMSAFTCGPSKDGCWQGMTTPGSIVPMGGTADGTKTVLYGSLRKIINGHAVGLMPCNPQSVPQADGGTTINCSATQGGTYAFGQGDLERITAWIQEGAQDN